MLLSAMRACNWKIEYRTLEMGETYQGCGDLTPIQYHLKTRRLVMVNVFAQLPVLNDTIVQQICHKLRGVSTLKKCNKIPTGYALHLDDQCKNVSFQVPKKKVLARAGGELATRSLREDSVMLLIGVGAW
jgi:hypothetical protein